MTTPLIHSYADLVAALVQDGVPHTLNDQRLAAQFSVNRAPVVTLAVVIWEPRALLVQFWVPLPFVVPIDRMLATESAIARLNHALILPGFGINHDTNNVYFRSVLQRRMDGAVDYSEVKRELTTAINAACMYFSTLRDVALGEAEPSTILQAAQAGPRHESDNFAYDAERMALLGASLGFI